MENLNKDTNRVYFIIQTQLKSNAEEVQKWIRDRSSKYVFDLKEEKSMSYEWFLSDDNTEATLIESFEDSDGAKKRVENHFASPLPPEVAELFELTSWLVFGNVKEDLIELLSPVGAKYQSYVGGFNHR